MRYDSVQKRDIRVVPRRVRGTCIVCGVNGGRCRATGTSLQASFTVQTRNLVDGTMSPATIRSFVRDLFTHIGMVHVSGE